MRIEITREYTKLCGGEVELLSGLTMLVKSLLKNGVDKELIKEAVNLGFMSDKEIDKKTEKIVADILKKLGLEG